MTKKIYKLNKGFTLLETLVSISIFSLSVLAMITVLSKGIASTNYTKRKIIATYLAQEGIEYVRNMRDTFVLYDPVGSSAGWSNFRAKLPAQCESADGCYFDADSLNYGDNLQPMTDITITACGATCLELKYDSTTGKYNYLSGVNSGYSRKINITSIGAPVNEIKVSSTVSWAQGSTRTITFSENLYNWIEQ